MKALVAQTITNKNFLLENVRIGLVKNAKDEKISRKGNLFRGTREVLYVNMYVDMTNNEIPVTVYLTNGFESETGITEYELWENAMHNTKRDTVIQSLRSVIFGYGSLATKIEKGEMYAVTNVESCLGASSILNMELLDELTRETKINKLFVIPSSIHEVIVIPYTDDMTQAEINEIIGQVNDEEVDEKEQLADHVTILEIRR